MQHRNKKMITAMKKRLFLILFVLLPSLSFGQEMYGPFLEEGKVWMYHYYNDFTGKEFYQSLIVKGDTVIGDKSYKTIVDVATGKTEYVMREKGKKVYWKYLDRDEYVLYDFGLNVGEPFKLYDDDNGKDPSAWATVVSVDTVVVGKRSFRVMDVRPNNMMGWPNLWVEGIGGMYGFATNYLAVGNFYSFSSCQLNGETLFAWRDFGTSGIIGQPQMSNKGISSNIYDLRGRQLIEQPRKGIYIRDGLKLVVK